MSLRSSLVWLASFSVLVALSSSTGAQEYVVSVEESGAAPTAYQKRHNWRLLPGYRHTTMVASGTDPLACSESPCLDDGEPGDQGPDLTRGGTATAVVAAMVPGLYRLELRYNQTQNRTTAVPWSLDSDATDSGHRAGSLDQRNTSPGAGNWLVLGDSDQSPVAVQTSATFVFGSTATTFDGSLSYGGIRLTRVADLPPVEVTTPQIAPAGGTFEGPVDIHLWTPDLGAELAVTIDGSLPELPGDAYGGPFALDVSATVKVLSFVGNGVSELATADFAILSGEGDPGAGGGSGGLGGGVGEGGALGAGGLDDEGSSTLEGDDGGIEGVLSCQLATGLQPARRSALWLALLAVLGARLRSRLQQAQLRRRRR